MKECELFGMDPEVYRPYEIPVLGVALVYRMLDNAVGKYLSPFGLSVTKFNVLAVLEYQSRPEGLSQVELSKKVIITASNMARLLERMEKEELIKRYPHKTDRRVNLIKITDKAKKLLASLWDGYDETVKNLAARLTKEEQAAVSRLMAKWFVKLKAR